MFTKSLETIPSEESGQVMIGEDPCGDMVTCLWRPSKHIRFTILCGVVKLFTIMCGIKVLCVENQRILCVENVHDFVWYESIIYKKCSQSCVL